MNPETQQDDLAGLLTRRNIRPTQSRLLILATLKREANHLSVDELADMFRHAGQKIGIATLYQNLNTLADSRLLRRFVDSDGVMRFDSNLEPHQHIVCSLCETVMDITVDKDALSTIMSPHNGNRLADWQVDRADVELHGLCPSCRNKGKRK
jgi:Fur family peroxide stress response transcriptional regulator